MLTWERWCAAQAAARIEIQCFYAGRVCALERLATGAELAACPQPPYDTGDKGLESEWQELRLGLAEALLMAGWTPTSLKANLHFTDDDLEIARAALPGSRKRRR